jgi:poly(3-hydroxybutyrate) depolymerase
MCFVAASLVIACGGEDDLTTTAGSGAASSGAGNTTSSAAGGSTTTSSVGGAGGGSAAGGSSSVGSGGSSSGCGNTNASTGVSNGSIQANGEARTFVLSVPSGYDPNTPYPLVFAWHGAGGDGALARLYFGVEQQSAGSAIFVYPDGLIVMGNTGWDLSANGDDVQLFDAIYAELQQSHCVDNARVFSTGHSFGGYFTNTLGCARGNVLRAIAPVAGGGPFAASCQGAVAAWITHGAADTTVVLAQGQGSRDHWLAENGCANTSAAVAPSPCVAYDGCTAGHALHWCEHPGGHMWPSIAAAGIWNFFASMP